RAELDARGEIAAHTPASNHFSQLTLDGQVRFPTFGTQRFRLEAHSVLTGGKAPPQRWAYLGGDGTIAMLHTLELGGDQLLFLDSRYEIPLSSIVLGQAGSPTL